MDRRDLERFVLRERGKDRRQPTRKHRLPCPRRSDEQTRMPARRRDLERAFGALLARDVGEVDALVADARSRSHRSARDNDAGCKDSTSDASESAVKAQSDRTSDASRRSAAESRCRASVCRAARWRATESTPRTGRIAPSRPSSPRNTRPSTHSAAPRRARREGRSAIGRSKPVPAFR